MEQSNSKGISSLRKFMPLLILIFSSVVFAQQFPGSVAIGTSSPADSKLILQLVSTTKAFQPPVMTTTQEGAISSPKEGGMVYDKTLHGVAVFDGTAWQQMFDAGNLLGNVPAGTLPLATTSVAGVVFSKATASHFFLNGVGTGTGSFSSAQPACSDLSNAASSCSIDATNAANIGTGTLSAARFPALTGDVTSSAGAVATTVGKLQGIAIASTSPTSGQILTYNTTTARWEPQPNITTPISIANGGTGQATKSAGFDALSPCTSNGIIAFGGGTDTCITTVIGNLGLPLVSNSSLSAPSFQVLTVAGGGTGYSSITSGALMVGAGTTSPTLIAAGTSGNVAQSNGSTWVSADANALTNINAANILVGSLPTGRMPALTGDVTSSAGAVATTVAKIQGVSISTTSPTAAQVLTFNGGSSKWEPAVGGTGSGGINWITTGDAETNSTTGWIMYNDAAATPVDCTGGVVVGTPLTVVNTSPLSGTYSYLWTHGASNTQGTGFSYAFTLDTASATKVENTQFDMTVASGTWVAGTPPPSGADGDQTVWIYDVDSSTLIQPTTSRIYSGNAGSFHFQTYWQPVNSTSRNYRLCVHNATTAATAYTTKFDSFSVAPSTYTYGTPITDWVSYTPTYTGLGTVSTTSMYWRHVGDTLEVRGTFTTGTTTATEARISFPSGLTSASTIGTLEIAGPPLGVPANTTTFFFVQPLREASKTYFTLGAQQSTTNNMTKANGTALGSAQAESFEARVPIAGWSSGVQMSDSAPQTAITMTGTQVSQALTAAVTDMAFTATIDRTGAWNGTQFKVGVPGDYLIGAGAVMSTASTLEVYKNGSFYGLFATAGAASSVSSGMILINGCVSGDLLSIRATVTATATQGSISVSRVGSPLTIGATETVAFTAYSSAGITGVNPNNSSVKLIYQNEQDDTHGWYSTSTGVATTPYSGRYLCIHKADIASTNVLANAYVNQLKVTASGVTTTYRLNSVVSAATTALVMNGQSPELRLSAGDTIEADLFGSGNNSASTLTVSSGLGNSGYLSCWRIGL